MRVVVVAGPQCRIELTWAAANGLVYARVESAMALKARVNCGTEVITLPSAADTSVLAAPPATVAAQTAAPASGMNTAKAQPTSAPWSRRSKRQSEAVVRHHMPACPQV